MVVGIGVASDLTFLGFEAETEAVSYIRAMHLVNDTARFARFRGRDPKFTEP